MTARRTRILALETATRRGSVALLDGERLTEREADLRGEGILAAIAFFFALAAKLFPVFVAEEG